MWSLFLVLGYLGTQTATPGATIVARIFTTLYFSFFFVDAYLYALGKNQTRTLERLTKPKSLDDRILAASATFNQVTVAHTITTKSGKTIPMRKPDPKGILIVVIRLTKRLKESFD